MQSFFQELLTYNHHCNQKMIQLFGDNADKVPEKALLWLNHSLNAHQIWNSRILKSKAVGVWEQHPLASLAEIDIQNYNDSLSIIARFDLDLIIHYTTTKGEIFHNSIRDIVFHIINHTTYHRGQIMSACKESGIEPIALDYIFYKR